MTLKVTFGWEDKSKATTTMNNVVDIVKFTASDGNKYTSFIMNDCTSTYQTTRIKKIDIVIREVETGE